MISNLSSIWHNENLQEELINYAIVTFLRTPELEISLENFRLISHIYYLTICNGFGIADN